VACKIDNVAGWVEDMHLAAPFWCSFDLVFGRAVRIELFAKPVFEPHSSFLPQYRRGIE
jgi:hypothetical protein